MSSQDKDNDIVVQELVGLPPDQQAEQIADQFSGVSNLYEPLQTSDIDMRNISDDRPPPNINPYEVYLKIKSVKKKTATVIGDIPIKVIKFCAEEIRYLHTRYPVWGISRNLQDRDCYPSPESFPSPNNQGSTQDSRNSKFF